MQMRMIRMRQRHKKPLRNPPKHRMRQKSSLLKSPPNPVMVKKLPPHKKPPATEKLPMSTK